MHLNGAITMSEGGIGVCRGSRVFLCIAGKKQWGAACDAGIFFDGSESRVFFFALFARIPHVIARTASQIGR